MSTTVCTDREDDDYRAWIEIVFVDGEQMKYPLIDKKKTGQQIWQLMCKQELSVKDVAEKLEAGSVQCVYQWINGKRLPSIDNLYALADLLDADIDEILCRRRGGDDAA